MMHYVVSQQIMVPRYCNEITQPGGRTAYLDMGKK
jgi:hypothetical protein